MTTHYNRLDTLFGVACVCFCFCFCFSFLVYIVAWVQWTLCMVSPSFSVYRFPLVPTRERVVQCHDGHYRGPKESGLPSNNSLVQEPHSSTPLLRICEPDVISLVNPTWKGVASEHGAGRRWFRANSVRSNEGVWTSDDEARGSATSCRVHGRNSQPFERGWSPILLRSLQRRDEGVKRKWCVEVGVLMSGRGSPNMRGSERTRRSS